MDAFAHQESEDDSLFVEVDPTGRYGRYNEILGKGASKTVYRAFDEYQGIEVAWNQVKLSDFLQSPEDLERLYCEIHLLKTVKHKNIMKFYTSWVDTANRNINFITEMFTSGTLKQYRLKHKRVNIRAVKHWCRQILKGLQYLHSHDPPVIHRDLKCDNIFVNGNTGEVKIGDLGLAAILRKSDAAHCVGTPEFMAPEVYDEAYNELVDIYSFGMCVLEMVTFEYPYSECTHAAQIYKKVVSGKKPRALYKVKDPEVRKFVEKCLASASSRLSARELLNDQFLKIEDYESDLGALEHGGDSDMGPFLGQPLLEHRHSHNSFNNRNSYGYNPEAQFEWGIHQVELDESGMELFENQKDEHSPDVDISIKGKKHEDGSIFLRLRIADKKDHIRNIYFPFDVETDTALSVATEMVAELDITDQDVTEIADMIDGEISSLVPEWKPGPEIEETPRSAKQSLCDHCAFDNAYTGSFMKFLPNYPGSTNSRCRHGGSLMHGRFEEITHEADESEHHVKESAHNVLSQSDHLNYLWDQQESRELSPQGSGMSQSDEDYEKVGQSIPDKGVEYGLLSAVNIIQNPSGSCSSSTVFPLYNDLPDNYEHERQQDLRWLKAKYQMNLRELIDQQLRRVSKELISGDREHRADKKYPPFPPPKLLQKDKELGKKLDTSVKNFISNPRGHVKKRCPSLGAQTSQNFEVIKSLIKDDATTPKSFYTRLCLPQSLRRTSSLPVDAVDV